MELKNLDIETLGDIYLGIENNPELKNVIEAELQNRINNNTNFSREHLVQIYCK